VIAVDHPIESSASASLRAVRANPGLRRIVAGWGCGIAGENALLVALLVIAFQQGGALAVGVLGIVRMAPTVIVAPLAGAQASQHRPTRLLLVAQLIRTVAAALAVGVILAGGWLPLLFLVSAVDTRPSCSPARRSNGRDER